MHGCDLGESQHTLGDTFDVLDQQGAQQLQEVGGGVGEDQVVLGLPPVLARLLVGLRQRDDGLSGDGLMLLHRLDGGGEIHHH